MGCTALARHEGYYGRQIPARAVSPHSNSMWIATDISGMLGHPRGRGIGVLWSGRKFVFRRKPVSDRNDDASAAVCHGTERGIVRVETAGDETSAMEENEDGQAARWTGRVDTHSDIPTRAGNLPIFNAENALGRA